MQAVRITLLTLVSATTLWAQAEKGRYSGIYENKVLGLTFSGVYGWQSRFAEGSGVWTELASYSEAALDAEVRLFVRPNPFTGLDELREEMRVEFKEGPEATSGGPAFKEVSFTDVEGKGAQGLPAIQAEGYALRTEADGKTREDLFVVRTFYGKSRLYRVHCTVRRARAKRVRDLFDAAMASLKVKAETEKVVRGSVFRSVRGEYACEIPEGFAVVLPEEDAEEDVRFDGGRSGVGVAVYSGLFDGDRLDLQDVVADLFGDDLTFEKEDARVLGGHGFTATVRRGGTLTLIAGVVLGGRAVRVHTAARDERAEDARRVHEAFLKAFRSGGN